MRRRRLWPLPLSLSLSRWESSPHSDPVDRSLSGWLVVDQLYRKNLVNFVSTSTGYCTANHWPVSLVYYSYPRSAETMRRPGAQWGRMTLMKVTSRMFTGIPASFSIASPIEWPIQIFLFHDIIRRGSSRSSAERRVFDTAFVSKRQHFSRRDTDPLLNYD